ncbi:MAG: four helix bundle protein [Clostridium butyricum]|nr:four helix bundle protein [Clostridium butyricum]
MKQNLIRDRSFTFAIKIVDIYKYLINEKKEFVLSRQLLRSGTSIGANVKESINAISRADFRNKMSIALKEADETEYWIELIIESNILNEELAFKMLDECKEICKILNSIVKNI